MVAGVVFAFVLFFVSSNGETEPQLPFGDQINVWIVAHTHDDTGWLETVDQYYVEKVRWILDTTTQALLNNPQRKFTYCNGRRYMWKWHFLLAGGKNCRLVQHINLAFHEEKHAVAWL
eukprot:m.19517 g.19517  ORF g.19517 m.19517 type:complete len:118 (+) comp27848_c0_seq7:22-375(+)